MARTKSKPNVVAMPDLWKDDFQAATMRTNFMLALSQMQIEFLCAVADDVRWDRDRYANIFRPNNFIGCERALTKRGLIRRKSREEIDRLMGLYKKQGVPREEWFDWHFDELTPAGHAVVELFKVTGIFVEADSAIEKKARRV